MGERITWAVSPSVMTTVDVRHSMGALWWPSPGMVKRVGRVPNATGPLVVSATSPTPDGFVHVSPGYMVAMGTRSIAPYIQVLDAIKDINILATPAHGSLTRWDLIVGQQNDTLHSDADNTWTVRHVVGNPSATPSDPAVSGSPDYVVIARVVVPPTASVNGILTANIQQQLTNYTVPVGGLLPVADQAARDALTGTRYDGMSVWRMDRDWVEVFDGAAFRVQGTAVCSSVADRNSAITNPYSGQLAVTTDSDTLWQYDGTTSAWVCIATRGVIARGNRTTTSSGTGTDEVDAAVLRVSSVPLLAGRLYRIWTNALALDSTVNADEIGARIRYTTNNTNAVVGSSILPGSNIQTRQADTNVAEHKAIQAILSGTNVTASFLLCVRRIAGSGAASILVDGAKGDTIDLVIEDIGSDPGDTGVDL